jgi:RNA-directed DNA polymerase
LALSDDKTHITHIDEGFDFLGQNVRKYDGKMLIKPSKKNVHTFLEKVQGVIKQQRNVRTIDLIKQLNPMIRGWAMYHRHIVAKKTFSDIDNAIFKMTWRWAKRRHTGKKSMKWVKNRYYTRIEGRDWLFFDTEEQTKKRYILFHAASIPIKRHVKINSNANTYSPNDEPYFEMRTQLKLAEKWEGRYLLDSIYKRQKGRCAYCGELIELKTGWHFHHIVHRIHGGKDTADNLVILHPNCHTSVHLNKFSLHKTPPRPPNGNRSDVQSV